MEETPTTLYLVLPPKPAGPAAPLSAADLEAVAGGVGAPSMTCVTQYCLDHNC